jgi:hypothetical protein
MPPWSPYLITVHICHLICQYRSAAARLTEAAWVGTIDGYRLSENGTLTLGSVDSTEYSGDIGWTEQTSDQWTIFRNRELEVRVEPTITRMPNPQKWNCLL